MTAREADVSQCLSVRQIVPLTKSIGNTQLTCGAYTSHLSKVVRLSSDASLPSLLCPFTKLVSGVGKIEQVVHRERESAHSGVVVVIVLIPPCDVNPVLGCDTGIDEIGDPAVA